ncbi:hypothetical protein NDU88_004959 [Pleurodeles waltl]|uniref:Uncharacterized protein n=1 Tax=Pleurodeles waltl TaxID=8319 RepID=A0AAV7NKY9_PLEWA|nr:hypothetical protein NDU88_004959 [Pleurodeles waltl]
MCLLGRTAAKNAKRAQKEGPRQFRRHEKRTAGPTSVQKRDAESRGILRVCALENLVAVSMAYFLTNLEVVLAVFGWDKETTFFPEFQPAAFSIYPESVQYYFLDVHIRRGSVCVGYLISSLFIIGQ